MDGGQTIRGMQPKQKRCAAAAVRTRVMVTRLSISLTLFTMLATYTPLATAGTPLATAGEMNHNGQQKQRQRNGQLDGKHQPHLAEWFRNHENLTPEQQAQALQNEPGFASLPVPMQLRLQNQLARLNAMPPAEREHTLQRIEALEKLSPDQRQEIGRMMLQVRMLPPDQQNRMRRALRFLRDLPLDQRQAIMASAPFKSQFSDQENQILGKLMSLEPYIPPSPAGK